MKHKTISADTEIARQHLKAIIDRNYKPQPEWEDEHPVLATMIIISIFLFNPVSLFIIFMFLFFTILTWGVFF